MDCSEAVNAPDTAEFFVQRYGTIENIKKRYELECVLPLNENYAVAYLDTADLGNRIEYRRFAGVYSAVPKCYALTGEPDAFGAERDSTPTLEAMGIGRLRRLSYFDLLGSGVMIGFVDTGIDYTHPAFRNSDGSSRIYTIWDQTAVQERNFGEIPYGIEYTREEINRALMEENPYNTVPERDELGHGTYVAGVAAGNTLSQERFSGVAPLADIVMVKLRPAKAYFRELYLIPKEQECYQETDIAWGVEYLAHTARQANRPLVICMTLATNSGDHEGRGVLEEILSDYARKNNFCVITANGNEAGYGLHYHSGGTNAEYEEVELKIGAGESGFVMELWAEILNRYSVAVVSPTGELANRVISRRNISQQMNFLFEETTINLDYFMVEGRSGNQLILMRVERPAEGIWRFLIYPEEVFAGGFDIWLPVHRFVSKDTYFLRPDPDVTITDPGNAGAPITVASYRVSDRSIYLHSGRGFTRQGRVKPDVTAPGVGIYGPSPMNSYLTLDGAAAAALTAGGCALILEWAVTRGRQPEIKTQEIKRLLYGGAQRSGIDVPSREWGYGRVNFYDAFEELRGTVGFTD